jgi:hypothetical protein
MSMLPRLYGPRRRSDSDCVSGRTWQRGLGRNLPFWFDPSSAFLRLLLWLPLALAVSLWVLTADLLSGEAMAGLGDAAAQGYLTNLKVYYVAALTLLTVLGVTIAWLAAWWWARRRDRPAWSLQGLEQHLFEYSPGVSRQR